MQTLPAEVGYSEPFGIREGLVVRWDDRLDPPRSSDGGFVLSEERVRHGKAGNENERRGFLSCSRLRPGISMWFSSPLRMSRVEEEVLNPSPAKGCEP